MAAAPLIDTGHDIRIQISHSRNSNSGISFLVQGYLFKYTSVFCMSITNTSLERFYAAHRYSGLPLVGASGIWQVCCRCLRVDCQNCCSQLFLPFCFSHCRSQDLMFACRWSQHSHPCSMMMVLYALLVPTWMGLRSYVWKNMQSLTVNGSADHKQ